MQQIRLEQQERRKGWVDVTKEGISGVGGMISSAFETPAEAGKTIMKIGGLALVIYGGKHAMQTAGAVMTARLTPR